MGLGDSLYLQGIVRHLSRRDQGRIEVSTKYPELFKFYGDEILLSPFRRGPVDKVAHYINRKLVAETDQFRDCCRNCGIEEDIEFRLDWPLRREWGDNRPTVIVQLPRDPMGRPDGFGEDLLPDCRRIQQAINLLHGKCRIVQVGKGRPLFTFRNIDVDLSNRTTVEEMVTAAASAQGFLGYCSFIAPLAECLDKPLALIWSRRGLNSRNEFIRRIVPKKIFYRKTSRAIMDDCCDSEMQDGMNAFLEAIGNTAKV